MCNQNALLQKRLSKFISRYVKIYVGKRSVYTRYTFER